MDMADKDVRNLLADIGESRGRSSDFQKNLGDLISEARMIIIRDGGGDRTCRSSAFGGTVAVTMLTRFRALVEKALDVLGDLRRDMATTAANEGFGALEELGDLCFLVSVELEASRSHFDRISNEAGRLDVLSFLEQTEAKFVRGLCAVSDLARVIGLSPATRQAETCRSSFDARHLHGAPRRRAPAPVPVKSLPAALFAC